MKYKFDKYELVDSAYKPQKGMYARMKCFKDGRYKIDHWWYCREIFHTVLKELSIFFFSHVRGNGQGVASFIAKIEDALDVQLRSQMGPTQQKTIMWIRPSKWWISAGMRRSLFTILLRAAQAYKVSKDNFEEASCSYKYLKQTLCAFRRFLDGNTKYTGRKRGWYKQFSQPNLTKLDIDKLLIKP